MRTRRNRSSGNLMSSRHQTVLLHEVTSWLAIESSHTVVDATLGSAGHAQAILEKLDHSGTFVGIDADSEAIEQAEKALSNVSAKVILVHENFRKIRNILNKHKIASVNAILFDLGWRIEQLSGGRGLSFAKDEPLIMTYDAHPESGVLTAHEIVNTWDEKHIADILYGWGEEHFSRRIAQAIVEVRADTPIESTIQLAEIVARSTPLWYRKRRIHPATKTFQALRIAVNDEMRALEEGLEGARNSLAEHGRIAVITFHSIEDRLVKRVFKQWQSNGDGHTLTKKPIVPAKDEVAQNPRARSAKLRVIEML
jgi:16S rRNA (cytosine1402-N4)-methyltransferase